MLQISFWARKHVWTTRLIIIFLIYPLLNISGWFLGDLLALKGIIINQTWGYILSFIILFLFLIYPYKADKKHSRHYYAWKKTTEVLMICTTFCFILLRGNSFNSENRTNVIVKTGYASAIEKSVEPSSKKLEKEKKNFIKKFVKNIRNKYKNASKRDKTGMIIVAILVALGLIFLLGVLSCSIACGGAEGLAYAIFFIGLGAIIFGLVRVIKRINRGEPRQKKAQPEQGV
jgi:hypothetical protein